MSYTVKYFQEFVPIKSWDNEKDMYVSPDAQSLFNDGNKDENIFKVNYHFAALHFEDKKREFLERPMVEIILKKPLPNPHQQVDNLIRLLSKFNRAVSFTWKEYRHYIGSQHRDIFHTLMEHLWERKWIIGKFKGDNDFPGGIFYRNIILTIQGWERLAQMQKGISSHNKGFMAMKFSNKDLKKVLENHFKPKMAHIGFELTKLDDIPKPGLIDTRMLVEIQTSDFIVADLSDDNPGVYFEAGYAMGLGKTVIFTCEKTAWETGDVHFDVNHYQVIQWSKESPEDAAEKLALSVRAEFPDKVKISDGA